MNLLFVHDGPIFYDGSKYYEYSFHRLKERYSCFCPSISFVTRVSPCSDNTKNTLLPEDIRVIQVPDYKNPRTFLSQKKLAEKIIGDAVRKADMLILRDSNNADIAFRYAKEYGVPYIYECVGCTWDAFWNHSPLGKAIAVPMFLRRRRMLAQAPYVHYVTQRFLQSRYPSKGLCLGCSDVCIEPPDEAVLARRLAKIEEMKKDRKLVLGTAAALDVRYKGQEYVIRALPALVDKGYDVRYRLAGGNRSGSTYLRDLALACGVAERLEIVGSLSSQEMPAFYDSLDLYIQPSKQEGLPRSVVEAMGRACPACGSAIAGIPELLGEDFLFPKGNVSAIVATLTRLMESDLSAAARRNFAEAASYTEDILESRRHAFYEEFARKELLPRGFEFKDCD